jgi:hypothetical protein
MKFLHTSDWHLGQKFITREREEEHRMALDWLVETIAGEKIDVLLVAGDIFDIGNPPNYARAMYYNLQTLTFCRSIHIGVPLPPGAPIVQYYSNSGNPYFSIGFPTSTYASFFEYSYAVYDNNSNLLDYDNGTTPNPNPLVSPVHPGNCVRITIKSGNECGVNPNTPYDPFYYCFQQGQELPAPPSGSETDYEESATSLSQSHHGKEETEDNGIFTIYPNPSNGKCMIVLPAYDGISELSIVDLTGRLVWRREIRGGRQIELAGSNLGSGNYNAQLIQGGRIFQKKLEIIR